MPYQLLADVVLVVHAGIVLFVVGGLVMVLLGNALEWRWVNRRWFRLTHLGAIGIVVVQAWLGQVCALTTLESWLRVQGGSAGYARSFIEHWLHRFLYYEAPFWVFALAYTVFALLVLLVWWLYPPHGKRTGLAPQRESRSTPCGG